MHYPNWAIAADAVRPKTFPYVLQTAILDNGLIKAMAIFLLSFGCIVHTRFLHLYYRL